jgi:hypothetical protein
LIDRRRVRRIDDVENAAEPAAQLEIVGASAQCAYGCFQGVLLVDWRQEVVPAQVRTVVAYRNQLLKRGFKGAIHMAEPGLPLPDAESRRLARLGMEARTANRASVALVIFGTGFGASAIRSLGTAIFSLRFGPSTRICASTSDAATWLTDQSAEQVRAEALAEACEALRRAGAAA